MAPEKRLGQHIQKLRKKLGLTQQEMADRLHMSRAGYGNIELDRTDPPASRLEAIAEALCVSPGKLFPRRSKRAVANGHCHTTPSNGTSLLTQIQPITDVNQEGC
jgi:transcriptional regulator with XRE-family HTH domain